ncbi:MAG: ribose 5-phosphate isomerase B [Kiritimatiellia bacterium]
MKIAVACDHGGVTLKNHILERLQAAQHEVVDFGTHTADATDYPDYAVPVCEALLLKQVDRAILVCTTGIGMSICANRFAGVRASLCTTPKMAELTRAHNDSNLLALGALQAPESVDEILDIWLKTPFSGEARHIRRLEKVDRCGRKSELATLALQDPEIYATIAAQIDQEDTTINLIASENLSSRAVREANGSVLTNKYAEGYPSKRWYSGCIPVDTAERLAIARAKELFGADHANVQAHCGSATNMAVYFAVLKPGDTILSMSLDQGGHLSHGSPVNFSGKLFNIIPYKVSPETEMLDYDQILEQAKACKPKLIVAGASAYPRTIDFAKFREIADAVGAYLLVDMAHIAGLVAGGVHPSPVPYADFVTTTTHKTLRGPRGGLILCKQAYAAAIDKTVFPGLQGGPLEHTIAAKAVCFKEAMSPEFKVYARQIVANCAALAKVITDAGFKPVSGGTDNHLMLVNVKASGLTGKVAAAALDAAGIICNKNTIPFDTESPFVTSGIRIGTASVTTRGMKEAEMQQIGDWIVRILKDPENTALQQAIRKEVAAFAVRFNVP